MTATTHCVHGLAADEVPPDWPPLTATELAAVLDRYPALGAPRTLCWHSPRPLSAAALVDTAGGRVFVKRHHRRVRGTTALGEEHAFAAWLRERGIPVPKIVADATGCTAISIGDWTYEVQASAAGIDVYRDTMSWVPPTKLAHARRAGAMLAQLHDAAAGYDAPQRSTHVLVARSEVIVAADPLAALEAQLPERPDLATYLRSRERWRAEFVAAIAPFHACTQTRLAEQPPLWTHGDWHVSNLCWSDTSSQAQIASVLDFGLAARNFALFDLATAIERNAIAWLETGEDRARPAVALALIDGYRERRALGRNALALLADLLPIVHVDFALSEVAYFDAITQSRTNADVAWSTFLCGHATWFRTSHGQDLLRTIRNA